VEEAQQNSISAMRLKGERAVHVGLRQDALGQSILLAGKPQRPTHIESQVSDAVSKGQPRLRCRQRAPSAGRGEATLKGFDEPVRLFEVRWREGRDEYANGRYRTLDNAE
jgi:hypothetical protein